ncbi:hypothetical protein [Serratia marcescens]|nr:hypothetical protein [Serratia marcescens]
MSPSRPSDAQACAEAQTIKLCDLIDNSKNITDYDVSFARHYLVEMARLLAVLSAGEAGLLALARRQCAEAIERINDRHGDDGWFDALWRKYEAHLKLDELKTGSAAK